MENPSGLYISVHIHSSSTGWRNVAMAESTAKKIEKTIDDLTSNNSWKYSRNSRKEVGGRGRSLCSGTAVGIAEQ